MSFLDSQHISHEYPEPTLPPQKRRVPRAVLYLGVFVLLALGATGGIRLVASAVFDEVPARGGGFTEALIGTPRFVNPVLALSFADHDLVALVHEGLLTPTPDGLAPALAESYEISDDGLTYTFTLRENARFHDGEPVTSADVEHTILRIQDPSIKSPLFANWEGVIVETPDQRTVRFTLPEPYAPFLENATVGILPEHLWGDVAADEFPFSELNSHPVGAGPYRIDEIRRDESSIPRSYTLRAFDDYTLGEPFLTSLTFTLERSEEDALAAVQDGSVDAFARATPAVLRSHDLDHEPIETTPLPRIFGVFLNANRAELFADTAVREALSHAVNRPALIESALGGFGTPVYGPLPANTLPEEATEDDQTFDPDAAAKALADAGWKRGEDGVWVFESEERVERLAFTLSTAGTPELRRAADALAADWRALGAEVTVESYDDTELTQSIIRPRRFDALLFGTVLGRELDLYAFWHSSQRNDPGLNIAQYTNVTADAALERARAATSADERLDELATFAHEVRLEQPAVFLYAPDLIYLAPADIENLSILGAASPRERFMTIHTWYQHTRPSWDIW
ncbi:hypothetical protein GVX82_00525 [Patescibacteria group bacterium]|jgi:peptide/nickel transport system substrate-binding protein|nr:hypothetical protein [Patescibacteria group bacterium]